jgi:hypothetical protein
MARKASTKPDSGTSQSSATIGFEAPIRPFGLRHSGFVISPAWMQHFNLHLAPQTALRDSAFLQSEAIPQAVSVAKDNMAGVDFVGLRFAPAVLANGRMSSNQSGDCPARSAMKTPKAKPQSLPRQRDIRRALIKADLVDTALRDSAFSKSEATPQVLSKAKNNMVALPGQLFYSTQIPEMFQKAA